MVLALAVLALSLVTTGSASAAPQWNEVGASAGNTTNCPNQTPEPLGSAYVGWFGEPGVSPLTGQVYYVEVGWGVTGNPCTGGARVDPEISLPAGTQLAISGANKVRCFYDAPGGGLNFQEFGAPDCPQQAHQGLQGTYSFVPPSGSAWPTATGAQQVIWVPVKSSQPLNGLIGNPCNTCLSGAVWMIDGVNSPWVFPRVGVYVTDNGSQSKPTVSFPAPAVTNVNYSASTNRYNLITHFLIFTNGTTGTAYIELGTKEGEYTQRDPSGTGDAVINTPGNYDAYEDGWLLKAGKTFHYRGCYVPNGQSKICTKDQAFQTPPDTAISDTEIKRSQHKATFSFVAQPGGGSFECSLDGAAFSACASPKTKSNLAPGSHTFRVRTVDLNGNRDKTPATNAFTI